MRKLAALLLCLAPVSIILSPAGWASTPVTSVAQLDISRYAGQWYEIARLPVPFQKRCEREVTASYTLREDALIGVRNGCRTARGEIVVAEGVARAVPGHPGRLEVRFAPKWMSWLPLVWADYWVIDLDPGYTWAVVGDPERRYLWVLSRDPGMDRRLLERLKARAVEMGYDLSPLLVSAPLR